MQMLIYGEVATEEQIIGKHKKYREAAKERARKKEEARKREEERKKEEAAPVPGKSQATVPVIPSYPAPPMGMGPFGMPFMPSAGKGPMMMMPPMSMGFPPNVNPAMYMMQMQMMAAQRMAVQPMIFPGAPPNPGFIPPIMQPQGATPMVFQ